MSSEWKISKWFAAHTRSRHEDLVKSELDGKGFETFLPKVSVLSRRRDRRKVLQRPLFSGYLFVRSRMTIEERVSILDTRGLVKLLMSNQRPVPVLDSEIDSIRILVQSRSRIEPYPFLKTGSLVRVMSGPLAGVSGRVVEAPEGRRKIVCSVEMLGRSVAAELDRGAVFVEQQEE